MNSLHIVILSGGSGTRLWPISTSETPKQFVNLNINPAGTTLFRETFERARIINGWVNDYKHTKILIMTNSKHIDHVREQLSYKENVDYECICEPIGRDTAAAIAAATLYIQRTHKNSNILVMPADHYMKTAEELSAQVWGAVLSNLTSTHIITFGIQPTYPETGYGYIQVGENKLEEYPRITSYKVDQFREKPNLETSKVFLQNKNFYWNSGIFLFNASLFLSELQVYAEPLYNLCNQALSEGIDKLIDPVIFSGIKPISIDYALMEKSNRIAMCPLREPWSDVGSWPALYKLKDHTDSNGNYITHLGKTKLHNVHKSYIQNNGKKTIAVVGLSDIIVVETDDTILITTMSSAQDVKLLS